jgi:hypothetical protein
MPEQQHGLHSVLLFLKTLFCMQETLIVHGNLKLELISYFIMIVKVFCRHSAARLNIYTSMDLLNLVFQMM